ncbi:MAG: hypothetical protein JO182_19435 [Acidobacteriaceae bacterium]|nr:hypothetical protein [Acidobacteriaceae bacterium]MBV9036671.1 hypothetical protein [Acidobacteriaceae bacterium]MBV9305681.1 hypothetical protein [Acidobacteriaceae bacterium]MBV9939988.1 hypothetical protein [Acidobacteriaceae bacterium]
MRLFYGSVVFLLAAAASFGAKKVVSANTSAGNEQVDVVATIYMTEEEVTQKLGMDPGKGIALLEVRIIPKTDQPVQMSPDDFILLAHDDGERSKPFDPAQIAGGGAMVVSSTTDKTKKQTSGFGGFGGMIGGGSGSSPGNSKPVALSSKMDEKSKGNDKLLEALKAKQFPQTESVQPIEGYLYFPLDGKHKLKNMAVLYRGPAGRLNLEFEH